MRFKTLNGKLKDKNLKKYLIDWNVDEKSKFQTSVKSFFCSYWKNDVCCSEFPVLGTKMTIDLVNFTRRIAVEVDGKQHDEFNKFFHKDRLNYLYQIKRDTDKEEWCKINNIMLIRIKPEDLPLTLRFFLDKYDLTL